MTDKNHADHGVGGSCIRDQHVNRDCHGAVLLTSTEAVKRDQVGVHEDTTPGGLPDGIHVRSLPLCEFGYDLSDSN